MKHIKEYIVQQSQECDHAFNDPFKVFKNYLSSNKINCKINQELMDASQILAISENIKDFKNKNMVSLETFPDLFMPFGIDLSKE